MFDNNLGSAKREYWRCFDQLILGNDEKKLSYHLAAFSKRIFCENATHPIIQSYYIMLWANVDIHYAMNYIMSPFCTAFNQVAVVTLLKQLTVCSGADGIYVGIIKAIWDELFLRDNLRDDVLHYATRNVASYSLQTLAAHDPEMDTLTKLFKFAMKTEQKITLTTYNCIACRLEIMDKEQLSMISTMWNRSIPLLKSGSNHTRANDNWYELMEKVCDRFNLTHLKSAIRTQQISLICADIIEGIALSVVK